MGAVTLGRRIRRAVGHAKVTVKIWSCQERSGAPGECTAQLALLCNCHGRRLRAAVDPLGMLHRQRRVGRDVEATARVALQDHELSAVGRSAVRCALRRGLRSRRHRDGNRRRSMVGGITSSRMGRRCRRARRPRWRSRLLAWECRHRRQRLPLPKHTVWECLTE